MPEYGTAVIRDKWKKMGEQPSILDFADDLQENGRARVLTNASMTVGSNVVTAIGAGFRAHDTGKRFVVVGALGAGVDPLVGTGTFVDSDHVELDVDATHAVTGAKCVFGRNARPAILAAATSVVSAGTGMFIVPGGRWMVWGGTLDLPGDFITACGFGRSSIIYAADYVDSGFYANGRASVTISDLAFESDARTRGERSTTGALWLLGCSDVTVENLYINGGKAAGMYIDGCTRGQIRKVEVRNTKADGVHVVGGSNLLGISGIRGYNTGDDTLGIIAYLSQPQTHSINVTDVISHFSRARAVAIGGARDVIVSDCQAFEPGAHCYLVAWEEGFVPAARTHVPSGITFSNCRVKGALGSLGPPEGYQAFLVTGDATHVVDDITITNCTITGSNQSKFAFASRLTFAGNRIIESVYSGVIVEDSRQITLSGNDIQGAEGPGISFARVAGGKISDNRLIDCQSLDRFGTGGSTGRLHIVESSDVYGNGNLDQRDPAILAPSYGSILVSNNTRVTVGITEVRTTAPVNEQIRGLEVQSIRDTGNVFADQLLFGTDRQPDVRDFAVSLDRGVFVGKGNFLIDDANGKYQGSGASAELALGSGYPRLSGQGGMDLQFDRSGSNPGASFRILRNGAPLLSITSDGTIFAAGRLYLGNLGTSFILHGNGAPLSQVPPIAAQPGAIYIDRIAPLDSMILLGSPGPSPVWVPVPISPELPGGGAVGNVLRVTSATPSRVLQFGAIDLGVAASVQLTGATDRPVKRASNGALWADRIKLGDPNEVNCPGGLGDVLANDGSGAVSFFTQTAVAAFVASLINYYATIDDLQDQIDNLVATKADAAHTHSGTTGSGGSPAHTHSFST